MRLILATAAALSLGIASAAAQTGEPDAGAQPPTCAEALPQIQSLVAQAEAAGHDVSPAHDHVGQAEQAHGAGDEEGCINALIQAQDEVIRVAEQGAPPPAAPDDMPPPGADDMPPPATPQ